MQPDPAGRVGACPHGGAVRGLHGDLGVGHGRAARVAHLQQVALAHVAFAVRHLGALAELQVGARSRRCRRPCRRSPPPARARPLQWAARPARAARRRAARRAPARTARPRHRLRRAPRLPARRGARRLRRAARSRSRGAVGRAAARLALRPGRLARCCTGRAQCVAEGASKFGSARSAHRRGLRRAASGQRAAPGAASVALQAPSSSWAHSSADERALQEDRGGLCHRWLRVVDAG